MNYPEVLSEDTTLEFALKGRSIARYGDGELRICLGGTASAQRERDDRLTKELVRILALPQKALVCIPNLFSDPRTPKFESWRKYTHPQWTALYKQPLYGSAFITRPDSAPWIDRPDFWRKVRELWNRKTVVLCAGTQKSLTSDMLVKTGAKKVISVLAPATDAYAEVQRIEEQCMAFPADCVLLCLGPTATVLAARIADKGRQAVDLGHIGMFMRRLGVVGG